MNIRVTSLLLLSLTLFACNKLADGNPIDAQTFLSSLDGPKVPTVQDTLIESAKQAEKEENFKQASLYYQQALVKHPDDKDISLGLANSYRRNGNLEQAMALYDDLLKKDGSLVSAKEGKALTLMAQGDFDNSPALLDEVLKADPTRWKTLNALGILFVTRNMYKEAGQYFEEALKHSPSNPSVLNNLGLQRALDKQFDDGIERLSQASALTNAGSNDRKRVDLNLALVFAIAGKVDEAKRIAEGYFSGPVLNNNLGLYAHLAKDDQLAKAYLNMALTNSKVFYEKAWNNLQNLDAVNTPAAKPSPAKAKDSKLKGGDKAKDGAKPKDKSPSTVQPLKVPEPDEEILGIISDDTQEDKKP